MAMKSTTRLRIGKDPNDHRLNDIEVCKRTHGIYPMSVKTRYKQDGSIMVNEFCFTDDEIRKLRENPTVALLFALLRFPLCPEERGLNESS